MRVKLLQRALVPLLFSRGTLQNLVHIFFLLLHIPHDASCHWVVSKSVQGVVITLKRVSKASQILRGLPVRPW
ncbi:hypothetical protein M758_UG233500 [Ceratodon purpureus]|nr:hypothetical protein M758_UG233500 [Ceratodon purpureus]